MSKQNTTLKDIADILGVSTTTVHRAITGKAGVGGQMRDTICQLAASMGYSTNLAAAALKRKQSRSASCFLILPLKIIITTPHSGPASVNLWHR